MTKSDQSIEAEIQANGKALLGFRLRDKISVD